MNLHNASPEPIELNDEERPERGDADSSFGEESQYTVRSSIFNFRKEHGRTYHAYGFNRALGSKW
jgi:hypothetical protein